LAIKFALNIELDSVVGNSATSTGVQYNWYEADFEGMKGYLMQLTGTACCNVIHLHCHFGI